jgi:catechol 2,3-dioxygenase-like lactoylglutathione lyase family enzyme
MERPTHAGLRHLALNARDLVAMRRFYVDVLGFDVEWEPDADNVYLSSGIDNLALHRVGGHAGPPLREGDDGRGAAHGEADPRVGPGALDHLGLIVRTADDVDRWAAFLESRGVTLDAKPRTHRDGARSCYFSDPDGNKIQIIHHPPIAQKA